MKIFLFGRVVTIGKARLFPTACTAIFTRNLRNATGDEIQEIKDLFGSIGQYRAYELLPGSVGHHNNHLFSSWFFGVAWDWCLLALWPRRNLLWVGCLTDTD